MKKDVISINDVMIDSSNIAHENDSLDNILNKNKSSSNRITCCKITSTDYNNMVNGLEYVEDFSVGEPIPIKQLSNYISTMQGLDITGINKIKIYGTIQFSSDKPLSYFSSFHLVTSSESMGDVMYFVQRGWQNDIKNVENTYSIFITPQIYNTKNPKDFNNGLGFAFELYSSEGDAVLTFNSHSYIYIEVLE